MAELREVRIPIGKRSYPMQTGLDDETFKRVVGILNEIYGSVDSNTDQDRVLVLMCLQMAYKLERISGLLESLDRRLNDTKTIRIKTEKGCN